MILVISYRGEDHAAEVIRCLKDAGRKVGLLDMSDFPGQAAISLSWSPSSEPIYEVNGPDGVLDLSEVRVAWWRRIVPFTVDPKIREASQRAFAESETSQAVHGALDALTCKWVNPRGADECAHRKPWQWEVARRTKMILPHTLVTNDPKAARSFIEHVGVGRTVFKAFLAMAEAWRETRLIEQEDLSRLDSVRYSPVIFQEYIEGVDLRITVVGDRLYAAEIDARKASYPVDMRMVIGEVGIQPTELPRCVCDKIFRFMRELGLVYGAIDMRRTNQGDYVFLEVNPAGQWLFVEERTGQPISQAVADLLVHFHDNSNREC